jgi:hypothetical protein
VSHDKDYRSGNNKCFFTTIIPYRIKPEQAKAGEEVEMIYDIINKSIQ